MKIGLLGFTLSNANKGCEALTYSFLYSLERLFGPELDVCCFSNSNAPGNVFQYFPGIHLTFQPLTKKAIALKVFGAAKACDILFDISYGDGFSDIYNPIGVFRNTLVKQLVNKCGKPLILLPQTYGPFSNRFLKCQAANAIRNATYVFSRDALSTEYVYQISKRQALTVTDLAFALPYRPKQFTNNGKIKLGINVSGLLWKGGFHKENQFGLTVDYRAYITQLLDAYCMDDRYEVHLIPHVIETVEGSNDGDLFVNDLLASRYPNVLKAPAFGDPMETKAYIAGMDAMTAARMHATVDAFSTGVPVIPFAYSRKFKGLYGAIHYDYFVDGRESSTEEAISKTRQWIEERDELRISLKAAQNMVLDLTDHFYRELENLKREVIHG